MERVDAATRWAGAQVGMRCVAASPNTWHRSESGGCVLRLRAGEGQEYALKIFGPGRSFSQAFAAHRDWNLAQRSIAPPVLGWSENLRASLTRWWPQGDGSLDNSDLHALGALLGRLHETRSVDDDPMTLPAALQARVGGLLQLLGTHLGRDRCAWVVGALPKWSAAWAIPRVACHRDPRPRNCLRMDGEWRLIDFEHARKDACALDLAAALDSFGPIAFPFFLGGYREMRGGNSVDGGALQGARVLRALQSLAWDEADDARRRAALARFDAARAEAA